MNFSSEIFFYYMYKFCLHKLYQHLNVQKTQNFDFLELGYIKNWTLKWTIFFITPYIYTLGKKNIWDIFRVVHWYTLVSWGYILFFTLKIFFYPKYFIFYLYTPISKEYEVIYFQFLFLNWLKIFILLMVRMKTENIFQIFEDIQFLHNLLVNFSKEFLKRLSDLRSKF